MKLLGITAATRELRWPLGSPYRLRLRMKDAAGAYQDLSGREFALSIYRASVILSVDGAIATDDTGSYAEFYFDGTANAAIDNAADPIWEIAELYTDGKALLITGPVFIAEASPLVDVGALPSSAFDDTTWAPELDTLVVTESGPRGAPGKDAFPDAISLSGATTTGLVNPRDVYPVGDLCYVTNNGNSTIAIYDTATNPPALLSNAGQSGLLQFRGVVVAGDYLFTTVQGTVPAPGNSFAVFNVKNPASPSFVTNKTSTNLWRPAALVMAGNILMVGGVSQPGTAPTIIAGAKLVAFDITDPANPIELGNWATPDTFSISKFSVHGNLAYIATSDPFGVSPLCNFYVVDFSNPAAMSLVGTLALPAIGGIGQGVADVVYADGYCYLACEGAGGFTIVDVNTPAAPTQIVHQVLPVVSGGQTPESTGVAVNGRYVSCGDLSNSRFYIYDCADKTAPVLAKTGTQALDTPGRMVSEGLNTFIANRGVHGSAGLAMQNWGGPELPAASIGSLRVTTFRSDGLSSFDRAVVHSSLGVGGNVWIGGRLGALGPARFAGPITATAGQALSGGTKIYDSGANATDIVSDGNVAGLRVLSYGGTSSVIIGGVAGGTEALPTIPGTGAMVDYRFNYWNGAQFARFAEIWSVLIEPTPSGTAGGGRLLFGANALGSVSKTEIGRMDVATGLSMFGANPVIDQNRHHVLRSQTKAQLLALTPVSSFALAWCSDAAGGACPVVFDGLAWQKLSFTAL